jgi:peptide/nickel transport system substrate-binding protein
MKPRAGLCAAAKAGLGFETERSLTHTGRLGATVLGALVAALVLLLNASAQPGAAGSYGGVLVVGMARGDADSLDPTLFSLFTPLEVFRAICLRLYDFDARSRVVPELASALPTISNHGLTYTIPLRHGLQFNDGTPFNAQAVVTTLERDLTLPGSARASDLTSIDNVTTSGPYTAVIHLKTRFTPLLATLASNDGVVMSPTQLAKLGMNFGTHPVGVGPFMFDGRVPGDSITVIKSPYYNERTAVHLDKIVFKVESDAAAATAALKAGDIQMLDSVAPMNLVALASDPSVHLIKRNSLGWVGIAVNIGNKNGLGKLPYTPLGTPLASSSTLRRAFEEAIDRSALARVVYSGAAVPGCTPISPSSPSLNTAVPCTPYNPKDAKRLVAKSGLASPTVHLLTPNTTINLQLAQFIQAEEAAVGINVVIDSADNPTVAARQLSGSFDTAFESWSGSPATDRNVYQFVATAGSRNIGGYSNPRLDLILNNGRKASTTRALSTLYRAGFKILLADRPIIWLDHPIVYAAVSTKVKGVEFLSDVQARVDFAQYK